MGPSSIERHSIDEAILRIVAEGRATPSYVAQETGYASGTVRNRLERLREEGRVENVGGRLYEIVDPEACEASASKRRRAVRDACEIRQRTLTRVVVAHHLIEIEYLEGGPVYREWLERKEPRVAETFENFAVAVRVDDFRRLRENASDYLECESIESILEMSDRTIADYLKAIRALYDPLE